MGFTHTYILLGNLLYYILHSYFYNMIYSKSCFNPWTFIIANKCTEQETGAGFNCQHQNIHTTHIREKGMFVPYGQNLMNVRRGGGGGAFTEQTWSEKAVTYFTWRQTAATILRAGRKQLSSCTWQRKNCDIERRRQAGELSV